ncbi:hypothetical protein DUI87_27115 [Hirundo rustica rustica]|uniref:RNase H type-1 domain-containing protein n=1 Tax=Hirundo rustica rustica TaxID=333673 RepID=A0A3M0J877_HIRRU|nr:hypothetical protein DUI87_27115 [Hirundo rustica rustica]
MTWKDTRTQKWESDVRVVEGSPQIAEMAAVVRALEKFKDQPFNLITDSAYVAGIAMRAEHAFLKEVSNRNYYLLSKLIYLISHRKQPYHVMHVRSHPDLPSAIMDGNKRADTLAMVAQTPALPDTFQQAKLSHQFYHEIVPALVRMFHLTREHTKAVNTNPPSYKKRQSMETRHILLLIVFIITNQTVLWAIEHPETDAAVQKMLRYAIAQHDKSDYHLFPSQIVKKQTPKDHSEMRGSYRVTVMWMLLTLLMLLDIKAWKMGQPPENMWVTLAKTLRQDNLCLSMGSISSPLSSCLVGIPFKINEPSPLHPFAGNWPALPTTEKGPPEKPGNSG